eukprot:scaffold187754_cov63-Attheya_sp.AAC.1
MQAERGDVTGVKAKHFRWNKADHVFRLKKLGECNRYYMRFNSGKSVYEDDGSSHNIKTARSSTTIVKIVRV